MMTIAGATTLIAVAAVIAVIGYRVSQTEESGDPADVTTTLPKGARIVGRDITDERIVLTIEVGGATEIRMFDIETLKPIGRLRITNEP